MTDLAQDMIADLLRSGWIVQKARESVYRRWSASGGDFGAFADRAATAAKIVEATLPDHGKKPDEALVEPHADWMRSLAGADSPEVAFGDIFIGRLGAWVAGHTSMFLGDAAGELESLGAADVADIGLPESLPEPPPFEPVATVEVEPPGEVTTRFGILADLHIGSALGEATARAAIADLNRSGAEYVIQLGDITDHGNMEEFELAQRVLADLEMPYATMMGNHDVYSVAEERLSGGEYYPAAFGRPPDGVLIEHAGLRFAVLDSVEVGTSPFNPFNLATGSFMEGPGGAVVRGTLTEPQHDILAEVASVGAPPAFVFLHHPPQPFVGFPPVIFGLRDADSGRLHATCDSGNVWGVFAGHTHRNNRTRHYGTVPAQEVAMPRDYPFGYALVDVTATGYAFRFVQLSDQELLRGAYRHAGEIHRRYGLGTKQARGFVWTKP